jgi:hypothetical protein
LPCLRQVPIAILLAILIGCVPARGGAARQVAVLPLRVSENGRYLIDQRNTPFLVVGDTAWSIIAQLDGPDIDRYLDDRQTRGFNSIIVNLIEHKFCTTPPKTRSGLAPFDPPGDFSAPNSEYFEFAHKVVQKANEHGIVVWLAPAYLGYGGGDEGFFREIKSGGKDRLRAYGRFIGRRFMDLPNIVWLLGGDYTPPPADRWSVTELALGIHEVDTNRLMTVHDSPENSAAAIFGNESWLTVDTVYSYQQALFVPLLGEYAQMPARPFVLIETTYEGEHDSKPEQIRRQAYWAMLGGACGQFLGNNPIWHFDGPGLFPTKLTWQRALDAVGTQDMVRLCKLFVGMQWQQLKPAQADTIVIDEHAKDTATALTARTMDGKLAITYFPSTGVDSREFTVDAGLFAGPVVARWYNPCNGSFVLLQDSPLANHGRGRLSTPGNNGTSANDWVLILDGR